MTSMLYRALLRLAPRDLRDQYGAEMEALFAECLARERRRRTLWGGRWSCVRGLADLLGFALRARWEQMTSRSTSDRNTRRTPVVVHDIRGAVRLMRSQPVLSTAIVLMLALGIGATTAIFSVVHGVLLKPLPFPDADRIVQVRGSIPSRGWSRITLTEANFWDLYDRNRTLEEFGILSFDSFTLTGEAEPQRVSAGEVTTGFFRALGVRPVLGRLFEKGEDLPGRGERLVLLGHRFWNERFGGDRSIVGRALTLDNRPYSVVGVLPPGTPWLDVAEVFVPFERRPNPNRGSFEYTGIARLKNGVTDAAAAADLSAISKSLEREHPSVNAGLDTVIDPSRTWIATEQVRRTLWILLGSVGLLLLIACLNVTNLLLVRASARARENAVRTALGASRADLVRERLTESLLYSVLGTAIGWFLATWMLRGLQALPPGTVPRLSEASLDLRVLAFSASAALIVGLFTGLVPALRTPMGNIVTALRPGARGAAGDRGQTRLRHAFVTAEVALALLLLVGAGLLVRSLVGVLNVDRGFTTANRLFVTVSAPSSYGAERLTQVNEEILARLKSLPGVLAAAAINVRPLSTGSVGLGLGAADKPDTPGAPVPWATWRIVTPDYFKAMGLRLIAGREFTSQDILAKPWRTVVSKRAADLMWPGENPIGKTAILWRGQGNRQAEVIGVVSDMRERGLENEPTLAVYFPAGGAMNATTLQVVIHTSELPQSVVPAVRTVVNSVDPSLPVSNVRTLDELVSRSLASRRLTMWLLAAFAGVALVLALAGVSGVLAYSVARRTSEIGVRLALGAEHGRVLRSVVAGGMRPVLVGAAIGLAAAVWLSRFMANLLFEVTPRDPATYTAMGFVVLAVALLACYIPARRVLRVDPAVALRVE
jgi:putative ABC transport system permease protein